MPKNIGTIDQAIRLVGGLALLLLAIGGFIGPWGYIGVIPLATSLFGYCPLYQLLGISSNRRRPGGAAGN